MPIDPIANITGRDTDVVRKALAYAIEAIDRLPQRWQESSDRDDMVMLLEALGDAELHRYDARLHLKADFSENAADLALTICGDVADRMNRQLSDNAARAEVGRG